MHLVAYLREGLSDVGVERAALDAASSFARSAGLYRKAPRRSGLMLGFAGYPRPLILSAAAQFVQAVRDRLMC